MSEEKLELRRKIKSKKPTFLRQDAHRVKRLKRKWQKPRGLQSKMRIGFRGYRRLVRTGFGSPLEVKGLSREGLVQTRVERLASLDNLDPKIHGIIIASGVSMKNRSMIIEAALGKNFVILNIKKPDEFSKQAKEKLTKRKELRKLHKNRKTDKKASEKKKEAKKDQKPAADKKSADENQEENKDKAKEVKDKVLTKKGAGY